MTLDTLIDNLIMLRGSISKVEQGPSPEVSVVKADEEGGVGDVGVVDHTEYIRETKAVLIHAVQVGC